MIINDTLEIVSTDKGINLLYKNGNKVLIDSAGIHTTTNDEITLDIVFKDEKTTIQTNCPLCDGHRVCGNCYYHGGTYHCFNCVDNSEWKPLGDTYCRKCGRKLKTET